jgi:very-short-patch-repair endonuclease
MRRAATAPKPQKLSEGEEMLALHIRAEKLPQPEREWRFHEVRKWRFDFAYPERMLALEVEGGVHSGGRHTRGSGFIKDAEKYNAAAMAGWRVLRFATSQVRDGTAIAALKEALK